MRKHENDMVQGNDVHIAAYMAGTPDLVSNGSRSMESYPALYSRVSAGRYVNGRSNTMGVLMELRVLSREEVIVLLSNLRDLHAIAYDYETRVTDEMIYSYTNICFQKMGVDDFLTPRQLSREFIPVLDALYNDPSISVDDIMKGVTIRPDISHDNDLFSYDGTGLSI